MEKTLLRKIWDARLAYLLLSPLFIGLAIFCYYPPVSGMYHAFFDWDALGKKTYIGLDNFRELFQDPVFLNSIPTMFLIVVPKLLIGTFVPLVVAELIFAFKSQKWKFRYRVLLLLPMVAPGMVFMLIWGRIFDPINGLITQLGRGLGLIGADQIINWLGDSSTVIPSLIFMGFPWIGGTAVLIYMAGIMNISSEVIESSVLDGASTWRRILSIDLPLLMGQIRYFFIFGLIAGIQDYNLQIVLTGGGPGYDTYVPGYYMYLKAFGASRMGYASAVGLVMFVAIFFLTILSLRYLKANDDSKN